MNNVDAFKIMEKFSVKHTWNHATMAYVCLRYIALNDSTVSFETFLEDYSKRYQ